MDVLLNFLQGEGYSQQMIMNCLFAYWMWRTERRVFKIEQWLKYHIEKTT